MKYAMVNVCDPLRGRWHWWAFPRVSPWAKCLDHSVVGMHVSFVPPEEIARICNNSDDSYSDLKELGE